MKKRGDFIRVISTVLFALLVVSSPLLANAMQLMEEPSKEIVEIGTTKENGQEQEDAGDHSGDHSASSIDQTIVVNGQGSITSLLPTAAKQLYFSYHLPIILSEFQKYVHTAIEVTLLCCIKNILLFYTAPHAP